MNAMQNYVSAGTRLMAESLRDYTSIVGMQTFRDFMDVTEVFNDLFTPADRFDQVWHEHARHHTCVMTSFRAMRVEGTYDPGSTLVPAMIAYTEQSSTFLVFIVGRRDRETVEPMLQAFDILMSRLINEIQEVPHSMMLDTVLQEYRRCRCEIGY